MNRLTAVLATSLLLVNPTFAATADETFESLAESFIGDLAAFSPVNATIIGDHSADHQLDDISAAARDSRLGKYRDYLEALEAIDRDALSRANQVDAAMLRNELESSIWSLETLQEWAWNPLYYVNLSGNAIYGLLARDFAPVEQRLDSAASRLQQLPRFLAQAREALQPGRVPKIHAETAIQQNPGLGTIIDAMMLPAMEGVPAETRARLEAAIEVARDAIAEHQTWLEEELLPRAGGDFRIGGLRPELAPRSQGDPGAGRGGV